MARRFRPAAPPQADRPTIKRARIQRDEEIEKTGSGPAHEFRRGGFSSKIHLVTDGQDLPLGAVISGEQRHESAFFTDVMNEVQVPQPTGRPKSRPEAVAGDKDHDTDWIRQWCLQQNIESFIPARKNTWEGPGRPAMKKSTETETPSSAASAA